MGLRFNKWTLNVSGRFGGGHLQFRSDYRATAKKNAGKRLTEYVRELGDDATVISGATLSNGIFHYKLVAWNGRAWVWEELPGPGR